MSSTQRVPKAKAKRNLNLQYIPVATAPPVCTRAPDAPPQPSPKPSWNLTPAFRALLDELQAELAQKFAGPSQCDSSILDRDTGYVDEGYQAPDPNVIECSRSDPEQAERLWSFAHDMLWDYPGGMPAGRRVLYPHEHQANADISPNVAIEGGEAKLARIDARLCELGGLEVID
ncbi:hypothetical protein B0H13DRAFT_1885765 [Mycena leptocephala]|nr:hypothetical protein B0H13DRAFT_1885765 [Mycena leptocephala]